MNEKTTRRNSNPKAELLKPAAVPGHIVRRRILALASTTAALGLTGCGMLNTSSKPESTYLLETDSRPVVLTKQQEVAKKAQEYASTVEAADKTEAIKPAATATPTPVILASTGNNTTAHPPETITSPAVTPAPTVTKATDPIKSIESAKITDPVKIEVTPIAALTTPTPVSPTSSGVNSSTPVPSAVISPIAPRESVTPTAMSAVVAAAPTMNSITVGSAVPATAAEPTLEQALEVLRKHIAEKPTLNSALALSLLDTADAKAPDASLTKDLSAPDQKLFSDLLTALQTLPPSTANATVPERAATLVAAAKKWEADADLALPKLVLASRVDSYGVYNAVDPKFEAGKRTTVIIYCEVANFVSKKGDDGWFQTRLSQQETLITEDGLLVWRPNPEEVEDRSMNQRRDFYLVKKLTIPENLAAGKYTLRMSVTDKNSNKISMVSIPVEVAEK